MKLRMVSSPLHIYRRRPRSPCHAFFSDELDYVMRSPCCYCRLDDPTRPLLIFVDEFHDARDSVLYMSKMFMAITAGHENPGGAPEERANVDHHINPVFRRYPSE
jgi:hypothetical protein